MQNIFSYMDYREYLETFFLEKKRENPHFSYQVFADKAGFKSKSFIKLVIDGKKNLTEQSIGKLNKVLLLKEKEFDYFSDLVFFNQAKKIEIRNSYFQKLLSYRPRSKATVILQQQFDFYEKWYHNTVRELVCQFNFKGDFEVLGKMVKPSISARQARMSVQLLEALGLIKKEKSRYVQTDTSITTGDEIRALAITNFHLQNIMLAGDSISNVPSAERDISCLIMGLTKAGFENVKKEIQEFRKKIAAIAEAEAGIDRVYHVNFQLFPTSEEIDHDQNS